MKWLYIIENKLSDKKYIGVSVAPDRRWYQHRKGKTNCHALKNAIYKYGEDNFTFKLLCCGTDAYIDELEVLAIQQYKTQAPAGYNITLGGDGASYIIWEDKWNKLLGTMTDAALSKEIAVSAEAVRIRRVAQNIPKFDNMRDVRKELILLLGKRSDASIANKLNIATSTVENYRKKYNIPPYCYAPKKNEMSEECIELLGTMQDKDLAEKFNLESYVIYYKRKKLNITSYKQSNYRKKHE